MKIQWIILFLLGGLIVLSCNQKKEYKDKTTSKSTISVSEKPYLIFTKKEYDLGTIDRRNELINLDFKFFNKSKQPIIIKKADVSCGCISVKIPHKPILKNKRGVVKISINTKQLRGYFIKQIFISSNAQNNLVILTIKGNVCN